MNFVYYCGWVFFRTAYRIYLRAEWFHPEDRKSTRLNSSHRCISYAVFCLKKKKKWLETHHLFNNLIHLNQSAAFSSATVRPNLEPNLNILNQHTVKQHNLHTFLYIILSTI